MKTSGLGKGLSSLIPKKSTGEGVMPAPSTADVAVALGVPAPKMGVLEIPLSAIDPNPRQPRLTFEEEPLDELVASIKEHGVLQPLVVTKQGERYELIAGERRLRASKLAGLAKVPVVVRSADEQQKLELALIENIQRADLSPLEEALAYKMLISEFALTQDQVAQRVGKSRPVVANTIRLLGLPEEIQQALRDRRITAGQARALLGLPSTEEQLGMFRNLLSVGMTAREVETAVAARRGGYARKDPNLSAYEAELRHALGTKVRVTEKAGKGKIVIDFYNREELMDLVKQLKGTDKSV